jgi:beta-lactam-binding protein with PASTA domain
LVIAQSPEPGATLSVNGTVTLRTNDGTRAMPAGYTLVPDLRGLTVRRAINQLSAQQLEVAIVGSGNVQDQSPSPGQKVPQGTEVTLHCKPRPVPAGNS